MLNSVKRVIDELRDLIVSQSRDILVVDLAMLDNNDMQILKQLKNDHPN